IFALSAIFLAGRRPRFASLLALATLVFAGAFMLQLRSINTSAGAEILQYTDGRELIVSGHVTREGLVREDAMGGTRQSIELETEQVSDDVAASALTSGIRLNI